MSEAELPAVMADRLFHPGERADLGHDDYHAIDALSASGIKRLLQSPMHYRFDRLNPRPDTAALAMGRALHEATLEPEKSSVVILPANAPPQPGERLRNAKKPSAETLERIAWWDAFNEKATGRVVLTEDQAARVAAMAQAIRAHPVAQFFDEGQAELSMQWADPRSTGAGDELIVPCKCRFDWLRRDGIAIDLKTCRDASPEGFARQVAEYRYHLQAAWYGFGHEVLRDRTLEAFVFVAVESDPPHGCAAYVLEADAIRFAIDECERALLLFSDARRRGYWRGYSREIQALRLPRWAVSRPL